MAGFKYKLLENENYSTVIFAYIIRKVRPYCIRVYNIRDIIDQYTFLTVLYLKHIIPLVYGLTLVIIMYYISNI